MAKQEGVPTFNPQPAAAISDRATLPVTDDPVSLLLDGLHQRDLVEPALLLSQPYLALPFVLQQLRYFVAPLFLLLGLTPHLNKGYQATRVPGDVITSSHQGHCNDLLD